MATKKDNTKEKDKTIAIKSNKKVFASQDATSSTEIQSTTDLSICLLKELDKIYFGVEELRDLHNECVDTQGFNFEKMLSMKGVQDNFPNIIDQIKKFVWDIFTDLDQHPILVSTIYSLLGSLCFLFHMEQPTQVKTTNSEPTFLT